MHLGKLSTASFPWARPYILLRGLLFLGTPERDQSHLLIERYQRRKHWLEGTHDYPARTKLLVRLDDLLAIPSKQPHKWIMRSGETTVLPEEEARINHYWGARLTEFGPDNEQVLSEVQPELSMQPLAVEIRRRMHLPPINDVGA
eukprot:SM000205S06236  [mRNA]  locus=s205:97112:98225:- [translate_table: standard]